MGTIRENLSKFEKFNELQNEIDRCDGVISNLKRKDGSCSTFLSSCSWSTISDNLGPHLRKYIGPAIISLVQAEKVKLLAKQDKLEIE